MNWTANLPAGGAGGAGGQAARECAAIAADLARLSSLIGEAGDRLLASFEAVNRSLPPAAPAPERAALEAAVRSAVTALQFQDMALQLTRHAQRRLSVLEQALSALAEQANDPLAVTTRMQPVRQTGMGAGSIELF